MGREIYTHFFLLNIHEGWPEIHTETPERGNAFKGPLLNIYRKFWLSVTLKSVCERFLNIFTYIFFAVPTSLHKFIFIFLTQSR